MQTDEVLLKSKYIYLDWNVIKYMKNPRLDKGDLDKQFNNIILKLKGKYRFPYSIAHIKDRANHFMEEHYAKVKDDFKFAESINDTVCVGIYNDSLVLGKEHMLKLFDEYILEPKKEIDYIDGKFPFLFKVDFDRIDEEHPMYEFLKERQGIMSPKGMEEFLQDLYKAIFQDVGKYKKLRDYVKNFDLDNNLNQRYSYNEVLHLEKLLYHLYPFLSSFQDDVDTLKKKWSKIAERWFLLNNKDLKQDLLLIQGYALLDMHPMFNEKLKKGKNTLDNIIRDGNHCFFASGAQYFVSEDERTREKVSFLYGSYGIKTKVVSESGFLNYFS
ncbi:hypothetical protein [Clostridium magnum]|uniref:hypothetical protein n=1 Tax=Clostridium magnum TaxID=33954 RepID=UPI00090F7A44|nr:hypothetical protein [Clostridium magnum]SHH77257.1 hypothetical protein SAMN02745944_01404 [Clostridium magnum DSM 2767]